MVVQVHEKPSQGECLERDMEVHGEDKVWRAGLGRLPRERDEGVRLTNWRRRGWMGRGHCKVQENFVRMLAALPCAKHHGGGPHVLLCLGQSPFMFVAQGLAFIPEVSQFG